MRSERLPPKHKLVVASIVEKALSDNHLRNLNDFLVVVDIELIEEATVAGNR
jgi:hypothetical protein